jgi:Zn-dependent protease
MQTSSLFPIYVLISVVIGVVLHEVMHGLVGYWLGDSTAKDEGRLTLNPLAHIDPVFTLLLPLMLALLHQPIFGAAKPVPIDGRRLKWGDYGMALVAIAGPLTNLVLALFGSIIGRLIGGSAPVYVIEFLVAFIITNVGFFVFNLIPFPPLDGSRVFYALAPEPVQNVMRAIESYGLYGLMFFMILTQNSLGGFISFVTRKVLQFVVI